ncbi:MAG TPA: FtsK/SpoIIIE domain-containing protein [Pirellulales bacterium]
MEAELIQRQRKILTEAARLVADLADNRAEIDLEAKLAAAVENHQQARQATEAKQQAELEAAETAYRAEHDRLTAAAQKTIDEIESAYRQASEQATSVWQQEQSEGERIKEDTLFETAGVYEAGKNNLKSKYGDLESGTDPTALGIESRRKDARQMLKTHGQESLADQPGQPVGQFPPNVHPQPAIEEAFKVADTRMTELKAVKKPKAAVPLILFFVVGGAIAAGAGFATQWQPAIMGGGGVLGGLVVALLTFVTMRSSAQNRVATAYQQLAYALDYADVARQRWQQIAGETYRKESAALDQKRKRDDAKTEETCRVRIEKAVQQRDELIAKAQHRHGKQMAEITRRRDAALEKVESQIKIRRKEIPAQFAQELREQEERHTQASAEGRQTLTSTTQHRLDRWHAGVAHIQSEADDINRQCDELFPDWKFILSPEWKIPTKVPPVARMGQWQAGPEQFDNKPQVEDDSAPVLDDTLTRRKQEAADGAGDLRLPVLKQPALSTFPDHSSLLFKAQGKARDEAIVVMQSVMLRLATTIPPGKARFVVIDPIGLGQNFAAFMHLGDFDEQLIGARIWTESSQIETRLADLTEQMEVVIQKYLRNEFETIEAYNQAAGEVAEPFRFLVIANFPANFSEAACRRLLSIVSSGARCGVHTLISVDTKLQLPSGFKLADLEQHCVNFVWQEDKFAWKEPEFGRLPLVLDRAPPGDIFTDVVRRVGDAAKNASRVEVPFAVIAPKDGEWWQATTAKGIRVALGPAGATKHQFLELGRGTAQHVLIAGKTGSGKSTLLHTLITSLALTYSPEELELYLIDFKKGVEFKTYATYKLPHARVVSVESDREFGLSVLQRLDVELRVRGEKFRDAGAQDVAGYRRNTGESLCRILLIIDEFQEFFVEDDKIAQEVGLLFDRLVRQGRAFGMHVLLGSQTLGGAYSLARTTLGQMGVRIALQCSEADAHLILSEENQAARLLSRPGEAIYNDAGGLPDANHPFQVAYLPDEDKEQWHLRIQAFVREQRNGTQYPLIVFEGNVPGQLDKNPLLDELLRADTWPIDSKMPATAWLGDPVAIKEPTAAVLRRQSGQNVLLIGQNDMQALAILAATQISLAAQFMPAHGEVEGARFFVLDGTPLEHANAGTFERVAKVLPHETRVGTQRDTVSIIKEVAAEVTRRQQSNLTDSPGWYLIIQDLQRFRDLRKKEDDFGFSRSEELTPSQQFVNIMREGPNLGIHVLAWCDSVTNMQRTFDRQALREVELRVLFQMSPNDSSALIDSPIASRLGEQRALFHSEELGKFEKFRPYELPTTEWLDWVGERFRSRGLAPAIPRPAPAPVEAPPPAPAAAASDFGGFPAFPDFSDLMGKGGAAADAAAAGGNGDAKPNGDGHASLGDRVPAMDEKADGAESV